MTNIKIPELLPFFSSFFVKKKLGKLNIFKLKQILKNFPSKLITEGLMDCHKNTNKRLLVRRRLFTFFWETMVAERKRVGTI